MNNKTQKQGAAGFALNKSGKFSEEFGTELGLTEQGKASQANRFANFSTTAAGTTKPSKKS